jgi:riboflavin synthase
VNLEKALLPTTRLGGHLVSGHVDGVGSIVSIRPDARSIRFTLQAPPALSHFIAAKGSICIEGISLTVNSVEDDRFSVNIVPHTLVNTTLKAASEGQPVNLEVDVLARYLERLLQGRPETDTSETDISLDLLDRAGLVQPQK